MSALTHTLIVLIVFGGGMVTGALFVCLMQITETRMREYAPEDKE